MTAVGDADCSSHAKAAFGEVQPVARPAPDTVERDPAHEAGIDATLEYQVLDQPPHVVLAQCGDDRGAQPEAAAQAAGHVVLAAALPYPELAGCAYAPLAGIEAEHHLAERH